MTGKESSKQYTIPKPPPKPPDHVLETLLAGVRRSQILPPSTGKIVEHVSNLDSSCINGTFKPCDIFLLKVKGFDRKIIFDSNFTARDLQIIFEENGALTFSQPLNLPGFLTVETGRESEFSTSTITFQSNSPEPYQFGKGIYAPKSVLKFLKCAGVQCDNCLIFALQVELAPKVKLYSQPGGIMIASKEEIVVRQESHICSLKSLIMASQASIVNDGFIESTGPDGNVRLITPHLDNFYGSFGSQNGDIDLELTGVNAVKVSGIFSTTKRLLVKAPKARKFKCNLKLDDRNSPQLLFIHTSEFCELVISNAPRITSRTLVRFLIGSTMKIRQELTIENFEIGLLNETTEIHIQGRAHFKKWKITGKSQNALLILSGPNVLTVDELILENLDSLRVCLNLEVNKLLHLGSLKNFQLIQNGHVTIQRNVESDKLESFSIAESSFASFGGTLKFPQCKLDCSGTLALREGNLISKHAIFGNSSRLIIGLPPCLPEPPPDIESWVGIGKEKLASKTEKIKEMFQHPEEPPPSYEESTDSKPKVKKRLPKWKKPKKKASMKSNGQPGYEAEEKSEPNIAKKIAMFAASSFFGDPFVRTFLPSLSYMKIAEEAAKRPLIHIVSKSGLEILGSVICLDPLRNLMFLCDSGRAIIKGLIEAEQNDVIILAKHLKISAPINSNSGHFQAIKDVKMTRKANLTCHKNLFIKAGRLEKKLASVEKEEKKGTKKLEEFGQSIKEIFTTFPYVIIRGKILCMNLTIHAKAVVIAITKDIKAEQHLHLNAWFFTNFLAACQARNMTLEIQICALNLGAIFCWNSFNTTSFAFVNLAFIHAPMMTISAIFSLLLLGVTLSFSRFIKAIIKVELLHAALPTIPTLELLKNPVHIINALLTTLQQILPVPAKAALMIAQSGLLLLGMFKTFFNLVVKLRGMIEAFKRDGVADLPLQLSDIIGVVVDCVSAWTLFESGVKQIEASTQLAQLGYEDYKRELDSADYQKFAMSLAGNLALPTMNELAVRSETHGVRLAYSIVDRGVEGHFGGFNFTGGTYMADYVGNYVHDGTMAACGDIIVSAKMQQRTGQYYDASDMFGGLHQAANNYLSPQELRAMIGLSTTHPFNFTPSNVVLDPPASADAFFPVSQEALAMQLPADVQFDRNADFFPTAPLTNDQAIEASVEQDNRTPSEIRRPSRSFGVILEADGNDGQSQLVHISTVGPDEMLTMANEMTTTGSNEILNIETSITVPTEPFSFAESPMIDLLSSVSNQPAEFSQYLNQNFEEIVRGFGDFSNDIQVGIDQFFRDIYYSVGQIQQIFS